MLSSGGIHVSNGKEYALSDGIDTIKHAFGGSPQVICKRGSIEELCMFSLFLWLVLVAGTAKFIDARPEWYTFLSLFFFVIICACATC